MFEKLGINKACSEDIQIFVQKTINDTLRVLVEFKNPICSLDANTIFDPRIRSEAP